MKGFQTDKKVTESTYGIEIIENALGVGGGCILLWADSTQVVRSWSLKLDTLAGLLRHCSNEGIRSFEHTDIYPSF